LDDLVTFTGLPEGDAPWHCHDCVGGVKPMPGDVAWGKVHMGKNLFKIIKTLSAYSA
jgi:hypothetical protein